MEPGKMLVQSPLGPRENGEEKRGMKTGWLISTKQRKRRDRRIARTAISHEKGFVSFASNKLRVKVNTAPYSYELTFEGSTAPGPPKIFKRVPIPHA
jgi:hypothetical protein